MSKQQNSQDGLTQWDLAPDFTGDQITALVSGNDPSDANYTSSAQKPLYRKLENAHNAARRWHALDGDTPVLWDEIGVSCKEELLRSIGVSQALFNFDRDEAENLTRWLASDEIAEFSTQRFARDEVARWLVACEIPSIYKFTESKPAKGDSLSTKERDSMLKMIVGMAVHGYKYVPKSTNNGAVIEDIRKDLAHLKIPLSDDTIRNYLKEAVETVLSKKTAESQ